MKLDIRVSPKGWGETSIADIKAVLDSAAYELTRVVRPPAVEPILVKHDASHESPMVLYERSPRGEIIIKLNTSNCYWSQYAYQFSHEFCHVLSNYRVSSSSTYKWLEESICELASLFTLRRMANSWGISPPYTHWSGYALSLNSYVQNIIEKKARQLPPDVPFSTWFRHHQAKLESNCYLRELNGVIAYHLLPLFEEDIYAWQAVRFLNTWDVESDRDLTQFFLHWFCAVPSEISFCVNRIAKSFGV